MKKTIILVITALCSFSAIAQTVPSYVPINGLVGWWPFNGNANDESINTNDGTVNGATLTTDRFGNGSSAYNFNGVSNYIEVISNSQLCFTSAYSISAWVNLNTFNSGGLPYQPAIVSKIAGTDWYGGFELRALSDATGNPKFFGTSGNIGGVNINLSKGGANINQWYNLIVTYDGVKVKLFINSNYVDSININGNLQSSSTPLRFGRRGGGPNYDCWYNGKIDDIGIWNRALTACEIKKLYNSGNSFTLSVNSQTVCSGQPVVLTAIGATNYTWSTGATSSSITVNPTTNTIYSVSTTFSVGCTDTKTVSVTVNALPTITAVSSNTLLCVGQTASLTAAGALTYTWSNGNTGSTIVVTPTSTANYTVTGTNALNCSNATVLSVSVSPCTGIEQLSQTDKMVNLYPNPTTSQLYISADFKFAFLQVLNSIGQLVFTKEATTTIDASSLSHGIYFIKLYNEQGQLLKVVKFIKE